MTNRDKIKQMSNRELAEFILSNDEFDLCKFCAFSHKLEYPTRVMFLCNNNNESITCVDGIEKWLEIEVE